MGDNTTVVEVEFGTESAPKYRELSDLQHRLQDMLLDEYGSLPIAGIVGVLELVKSNMIARMAE
jgi:hypothetical protein